MAYYNSNPNIGVVTGQGTFPNHVSPTSSMTSSFGVPSHMTSLNSLPSVGIAKSNQYIPTSSFMSFYPATSVHMHIPSPMMTSVSNTMTSPPAVVTLTQLRDLMQENVGELPIVEVK